MIKRIGITVAIVAVTFSLLLIASLLLSDSKGPNSMDIDRNGQDIGGIFKKYNNQIYASVPSNGNYLIKGADPSSFRLLDDNYQNRQFGVDKHHAYCGNLIVEDLNPSTAKAIGNDYFSDGKQTCYCAMMSVNNDALSIVSELNQRMQYGLGITDDKPQTYIYPFFKLKTTATPYRAILNTDIATNGPLSYYEGKILPQANSEHLRQIPKLYNDGDIRDSEIYLADGQHVYYKNTRLPLQDNADLYAIVIDAQNQENYLIDPKQGMAYVNDIAFEKQHAPYHVLSLHGGHVYHTLFLSKDGIFYFDKEENKVLRVKDNPFNSGKFKEIAPLIFSDGQQILYTETSDFWGGRRNPGLKSKSTHIYRLDEPTTGTWEKIGMVNYNYGSVWKNGSNYYYFDQLGDTQLVGQTIYRITDKATVDALLSPKIQTEEIRKLVRTDHMATIKKTELVNAKTSYSTNYWFLWAVILFAVGIQLFLWILRKSGVNPKPFSIENKRFKVNSLWTKSYSLSDIDLVVFSIETAARQNGYTGRFQIQTKDGKLSRKYMFATQLRLSADTKQELELYIADLQHTLNQYQVHSVVK
ncbi:DKNYY domain-containing protein [Sphingobacterium sp. SRCM116780]|uniref:DKNYY domain-containing protein n=1 Tax=Sphingobacterium sp. SRCM116780 TaxID=2907623 RepID=UPI001F423C08|nr:DKNYY domain-containing protein [Sphingobacterium sp. SRCM116780]UIR55006.1 DKNYY domain-containing protein [Sphingobacterium sp. SRCM116780]